MMQCGTDAVSQKPENLNQFSFRQQAREGHREARRFATVERQRPV
jgi:hypothetical protein